VTVGSSREGRPRPRSRSFVRIAVVLALCLLLHSPGIAHQAIDEQIADLTTRISAHPADAFLYVRRGELHRVHGDRAQAIADCDRSRRIDPGFAAAELCLARTLLDSGEPGPSLDHIGRFLEARPRSVEGWMTRGRAQSRLGRHLEAAEDFTRALAECDEGHSPRRPYEPEYFLERARALVAAGPQHVEQAVRGLDEGIRVLGPIVSLQLPAIDLELELGRYDAALARLDTIAARAQRREGWLARRATILERTGRVDEARAACDEGLAAIAKLPPARRAVPAIRELEEQLRATLGRLSPKPLDRPACGP